VQGWRVWCRTVGDARRLSRLTPKSGSTSKAADRKIVIAVPRSPPARAPRNYAAPGPRERSGHDGHFLLPLGAPQLAQADKDRGSPSADAGAWAAFGAELLLRVEAARRDGRIVLRAALTDVGVRAQLFAREDSDAPAEAPRLAHSPG
jgi:hypothetical protein